MTHGAAPEVKGKEAIILGILLSGSQSEKYGLELVEESRGLLKRGTVYVTLQRMEEKGLVASKQEVRSQPAVGIPRRVYSVTGLGMKAFANYKHEHDRVSALLALA